MGTLTSDSLSLSITAHARPGGRVLLACLTRGERGHETGGLAQAVEWRSEPREVAEGELEDAVQALSHQALARVRELLDLLQMGVTPAGK